MKKASTVFAVIISLLLSACTTHQMYDSMQNAARDNCNKLSEPDRSACLKRNQIDYDTYKKQREETTGGSKAN